MFYLMLSSCFSFFFFNDTATTEIYTLSLHDALPICKRHNLFVPICLTYLHEASVVGRVLLICLLCDSVSLWPISHDAKRSEEHTSELQSRLHLVCRLLLEKKIKPLTSLCRDSLTSTV